MTAGDWRVFVILGIIYLVMNIFAGIKVVKDPFTSPAKIKLNLILIWCIPFFMSLIVLVFFSKPNTKPKSKHRYMEAGDKAYSRY